MRPHPPGAVTSLTLGILALLAILVPGVGVLLGLLAMASARRAQRSLLATPEAYEAGGVHTAGMVTGGIAVVLSAAVTVWVLMLASLIGAVAGAAGHAPPPPPALLW